MRTCYKLREVAAKRPIPQARREERHDTRVAEDKPAELKPIERL
jgi:hypothetical protein